MKIRMLSTQRGSPDGATIATYSAGEVHDLTGTERARDLAGVFVREGWAEDVDAKRPEPEAALAHVEEHASPAPGLQRGRRKG